MVNSKHVKLIILGILLLIFFGVIKWNSSSIREPFAQINESEDVCSKGVKSGNYKQRVVLLTECINNKNLVFDSKDSVYFFKRGYGYERLNENNLALQDYLNATKLNKNYGSAYYNSGNIYFAKHEYDKALNFYNKAIEINPKNGSAYYNIGQIYKETDKCDEAIFNYNKAISLNKMKSEAYLNIGFCLVKQKKFKEAYDEYNKSLNVNPNNYITYNDRGHLFCQLERYEEALADYNKALEIKPDYLATISNRFSAYESLGEYELALEDLDKMVELAPTFLARVHYNRGHIYGNMKKYDLAIQHYKKAIELEPGFTWPYNNLAIIYYSYPNQKYYNPEKSIDLLIKATQISGPRVPEYNRRLAAAYARIGQFKKAFEYQTVVIDVASERRWPEEILKELQNELKDYQNNRIPDS